MPEMMPALPAPSSVRADFARRAALALPPSSDAPLAGLTLLAVEDSRFACEALRLMCQRSGARLRRAETLSAARSHLRLYRPDVVLVDLGLPDGDGTDLIAALAAMGRDAPVVLGMSGEDGAGAALRAGAVGFLPKPIERMADFRDAILRHLPDRAWLYGRTSDGGVSAPDPLALRDDLAAAARRLAADPGPQEGRYLAGFVAGLARASRDDGLERAAGAARSGPEALGALARALALRLGAQRSNEVFLRQN